MIYPKISNKSYSKILFTSNIRRWSPAGKEHPSRWGASNLRYEKKTELANLEYASKIQNDDFHANVLQKTTSMAKLQWGLRYWIRCFKLGNEISLSHDLFFWIAENLSLMTFFRKPKFSSLCHNKNSCNLGRVIKKGAERVIGIFSLSEKKTGRLIRNPINKKCVS